MDYTIELTQQELHQVGSALSALPYGQVAALMVKLQQQVLAQETQASEPVEAVAETI